MPKVNEDYFNQKKIKILNAALLVFEEKPVFAATMQDIIDKSGFSQGGIYRYFKDMDDILIAVHNRFFTEIDVSDKLIEILGLQASPENVLRQFFSCNAQYFNKSLSAFNKIRFELLMLYAAYPKRGKKIKQALKIKQSNKLALEIMFAFILKQVEKGYFKPLLSLDKITSFAVVSYDGILIDSIFFNNYSDILDLSPHVKIDVTELFSTLCDTLILMLGGKLG